MKTLFIYLSLLVITIQSVSCDHSGNIDSTPNQIATSGSWRVTLYSDSGNDETTDFVGYTFTFNTNGILSAIKNGITVNGSWSVSSSSNKFNIDLGPKIASNLPLGELTDDWKIISTSATEIKLTDDNAASNEFLTFTKN